MAAYAAVISLKKSINGLLNSCRISSTREILESAYNETTSLQQVLERSNDTSSRRSRSSHERLDGMEGQIRDFAHKLEDVLEFHEYSYSEEEDVVLQELTSFGEAVKKMGTDYIEELSRENDNDDDDDAAAAAAAVLLGIDSSVEMVGRSSEFTTIQEQLVKRMRPDDLYYCAFLGKQGSTRKLSPKGIFDDARKGRREQVFDCWAWVTVGPKHDLKEVLLRIVAQVDNLADYELFISQEDEKLSKYVNKLLEHRRYMIMLDDVDDVELVDYLKRKSFPDQSNGSVVFLSTTSEEMLPLADRAYGCDFTAEFFEEACWQIISTTLFEDEPVPTEMEVAGKQIINNCRCLIISFAKALAYLLESEKTIEEWNKIAADKQNPIFAVEDEISEMHQIKLEKKYDCGRELISLFVDSIKESVEMKIHPERFFSRIQIISFFGMAGIGKTTFVRKIWKDKSVLSHFDHHVWITLGQNYQAEEILLDILAQIYPDIHMKGDEKLVKNLCEQLSSKRCLIVLDDLWSKEPLLHLRNLFPDIRGTTLVTTRLAKVAKFERDDTAIEMQLLDEEESWSLLCQKVFGGGLCPFGLEKVGRKIAEKCDGLPLLILTVANELLKVEISQEYWNNVVSGKEKSVFKNAHHQISEALLPSYQNLPQHLKPCFLYIGVFREKYEIRTSDLPNLWIAEGFLYPNSYQTKEDFVVECLSDLVDTSLVMVQRKVYDDNQIKTCRLHSVFWHLCNSQAAKSKFFHAMNTYDDSSIERSIESQRRLCIRNSILLGMKDVQHSMASNKSAHSLLCVSPLHQYQVPLNLELRLLRVMNAVTIRLYEFPIEVVRLVHLRYLGLTCNGKLPTSLSNLLKLQYLIVKRYMNIKSCENSSSHDLPVEIWDMKELKHLQIMGGCLPNQRDGAGLLKLSTLLDVSAESCRDEVLKWILNLKRLGILIELAPDDNEGNSNSFRCLNNISLLDKLESLKCEVVNPRIRCGIVSPPAPISMFPPSLKKLSLSGLGYPWEYMSIIGKIENLEVLKLKCYAFQGPKWEICLPVSFKNLKFLLLEDTDLVHWKVNFSATDNLEHLCIKHCYKLKELPSNLYNTNLTKIDIVDCNPVIVPFANDILNYVEACQMNVHNSWFAIPTNK